MPRRRPTRASVGWQPVLDVRMRVRTSRPGKPQSVDVDASCRGAIEQEVRTATRGGNSITANGWESGGGGGEIRRGGEMEGGSGAHAGRRKGDRARRR